MGEAPEPANEDGLGGEAEAETGVSEFSVPDAGALGVRVIVWVAAGLPVPVTEGLGSGVFVNPPPGVFVGVGVSVCPRPDWETLTIRGESGTESVSVVWFGYSPKGVAERSGLYTVEVALVPKERVNSRART